MGPDRYNKKLKSPAQMEKLAGKEEVAKYTVKLPGKLTVAKMSDKRQSAGPVAPGSASAVFGVVETTAVKSTREFDMKVGATAEENIFGDLAGPAEPKKSPLWPQ